MANKQRHQLVVEALVKEIFTGKLKPGTKLPTEKQLSKKLKVDRTSLRLGLKQLEAMKVLAIRQGDGIYVRDYVKEAGLDFLGLTLEKQEEAKESWIDPYLMDEMWEFWVLFAPEVVELGLKRCSTRDLKFLSELIDLQEKHLTEPKRVLELELSFQDKMVEVINNTVLLLFFNSIKQIRKKAIEILVKSLDEKGLKGLLETKRILIEKALNGSEEEIKEAVEIFRKRCDLSRKKLREFMNKSIGQPNLKKPLAKAR